MSHPFARMTREEFLGKPKITTAANAADLRPRELLSLRDVPAEPFMEGRYKAKYGQSGCIVFDGDQPIASYNFADTLVVDRAYRRQGIAAELVYQWRMRYPDSAVARARTRPAQSVQQAVWSRIEREINAQKQHDADRDASWHLWDDSLPNEEVAQRVIALHARGLPGYEFRIIKSEWHKNESFAVEGRKIGIDQSTPPRRKIYYHATNVDYETPDPALTSDGGLHFGSIEQATMRTVNSGRRIFAAELLIENPRRSKDTGGSWRSTIKSAKAAGKDSIVYLNRYEGLSTDVIQRLDEAGQLGRLDTMTDAQFKRLVPEAHDSYIVFSTDQVRWVETVSEQSRPKPG